MSEQAARRCATCGCALSRFNDAPLCGPCSRSPQLPAADDLWTTEPARQALNTWDIGAAVGLYRRYTGAKQVRIAAAVGIDQSEVSRLERGGKKIRDRQQLLAWTRALGIPETLIPAYAADAQPDAVNATFISARSEQVIASWLTAQAALSVGSGSGGLRVTDQDLDVARGMLSMFRELDHAHGAGSFAGHLVTYIDTELNGMINRPVSTDQVAADRDRLAAEFLELAGYQAVDAGRDGASQHLYQRALTAAIRSGDTAYGGYLVAVNLGHLALHCKHPEVALTWAKKAEAGVGTAASPATRAAITAVSARALARMGREKETTTALMTCENLLDAVNPDNEPAWIAYFNRAYLADEIAHCLHDLGRAPAARTEAESAMEGVGASRVRRLAIDAALLASTWLRSGDVEQACAAARQAVEYTARTSSGRCRQRVRTLMSDLSVYHGSPYAAEVEALVREVLPEAAPAISR
ncbi:helix-turn-helix domain-containing protein [Catenulispora subtropica]|uniref:helix-turn-helix domain-containing protein n=1 Tax=Catenulispora subtropica TaxID=450798 RepID=UPI0031DD702E